MTTDHTVRSYDEELKHLDNMIAEMGGLAEDQFARAMEALIRRDVDKASLVAANDARIDALETQVDRLSITMLARRQPLGTDLRQIVGALKTASMLERVGDYAKNVARRTIVIAEMPPVPPVQSISRLGQLAQDMIKDVLDAYLERDVDKARAILARDRDVDALYTSIFRELLTYMMEDARNITSCSHLLFVAKNIERVGDHATNIAEIVYYCVTGEAHSGERARGDETTAPGILEL